MGFEERYSTYKKVVDDYIQELFSGKEPESLYTPMFHLLDGGGKRLRPLMLMLSCSAVGGDPYACIQAAAAIEILHTFTLVHDDIMDHDDIRRGRPTVHRKWNESTAILAGDGLVTLAFQSLLKTKHPNLIQILQLFTNGLLILCEGQALDKEFEDSESIQLNEYGEMILKKTATLMEVSCQIGAILGSGVSNASKDVAHFGRQLGMAFQIQDDLLDLQSEENILGKPTGSDIQEKKKTFLTVHFMNNGSPDALRTFHDIWNKSSVSTEDIQTVKSLFLESGTFDAANKSVSNYLSDARDHLLKIPENEARQDLMSLIDWIRKRIH